MHSSRCARRGVFRRGARSPSVNLGGPVRSLVAAAFFLSAASAHALSVDPAYDRFKAVVTGNAVEVKFSASGVPLAGSGGPLTATGVSGAGYLSRSASIATQHGPLPFTVSQRFSVASLAKGVAAVATNPLLGVGLAIASPFIYDWLTDSGLAASSSGSFGVPSVSGPCRAVNTQWGSRSFDAGSCFAAAELMTADLKAAGKIAGGYVTKCAPSSSPLTVPPSCGAGWNDGTLSMGVGYSISFQGTQTSTVSPSSAADIQSKLQAVSRSNSEIEQILAEGIKYPELTPDAADTPQVLSPQPSPAKTSSGTTVDPTTGTTTQTRSCSMIGSPSSSGNVITVSEICTTATTTVPPGGTTGTTVVGTTTTGIGVTVGTGTPSETPPFEMPCGVGSAPPCAVKVDETDVPSTVTIADPFPQLEQTAQTRREEIAAADSSLWEPVKDFFFLPAAATCTPFQFPDYAGVAVPELNPCGVVPGLRGVVAVLWSIAAMWIMVGWVREVI